MQSFGGSAINKAVSENEEKNQGKQWRDAERPPGEASTCSGGHEEFSLARVEDREGCRGGGSESCFCRPLM